MPLQLKWVGEDDLDRVAEARRLCYAHSGNDVDRFREGVRADPRARAGDFLLAERDGLAVGTATALGMTMWIRGGAMPCQGVAWVGTIKTHRRRGEGEEGVATRLMRESLRMARDRGQVVSALMPFRASFYEHFGYGLVERRNDWTVPLEVLPAGPTDGIRFFEPGDLPELVRFRRRVVERGQCDIERSPAAWEFLLKRSGNGFAIVDRPDANEPIRGYLIFEHAVIGTRDYLRVTQNNYDDADALKRQLHFLASLRDQYFAAIVPLPVDLPLNWLLRETQLPHRPVNHATADLRQCTRMQLRVLDHKRLIEGMKLPSAKPGQVVVSIRESEGHESRFKVDFADGLAQAAATAESAEFSCPAHVWAAIVCGDLPARRAVEMGLATADDPHAAEELALFKVGPAPFTSEYF